MSPVAWASRRILNESI